jgi:hypothetical protein
MFQTEVVEKLEKHILCSIFFSSPENRVVYEIMWKNIVERGRPQMKMWRMRIAFWMPKATNTHRLRNARFSTATMVARNTPHCYVVRTLTVLFVFRGLRG